jgi:hypothetical protein
MSNRQLPQDPIIARNAFLSNARRKAKAPQYTCEAEIRKQVTASVNAKAEALQKEPQGGAQMVENWIRFVTEKAKDEGRLLTNRQYQDMVMRGKTLTKGDRARYVGPDREEVSQDGGSSTRPHGQIGVIVAMEKVDGQNVATFFPADPVMVALPNGAVENKLVNMQVREGTREWLDLERV